jgi:hypothetical protein
MGMVFRYKWSYEALKPVREEYKKNVKEEKAMFHHRMFRMPVDLNGLDLIEKQKLFHYYIEVKENVLIERFSLDEIDYSLQEEEPLPLLEVITKVEDAENIQDYLKKLGVLYIQKFSNQEDEYEALCKMEEIGTKYKELDNRFYIYFFNGDKKIRFDTEKKNIIYFTPEIDFDIVTKKEYELLKKEIESRKNKLEIIKETLKKERLTFIFK